MIADEFESIKKALDEIQKEKEKEKAPKGEPDGIGLVSGSAAKATTSLSGAWANIFIKPAPTGQPADAQQAPQQATP